MSNKVQFIQIAPNEVKFEYKDNKFLLREKRAGVFGLGASVYLYQLEGVKKTFIKTIGWTHTDNHGGPGKECILNGIVKFEDCKQPALKYVQSLLD